MRSSMRECKHEPNVMNDLSKNELLDELEKDAKVECEVQLTFTEGMYIRSARSLRGRCSPA